MFLLRLYRTELHEPRRRLLFKLASATETKVRQALRSLYKVTLLFGLLLLLSTWKPKGEENQAHELRSTQSEACDVVLAAGS